MGFGRIILSLALRGIRYRYLRATGLPAMPEAISLEVTRRCIAKCLMCNIWRTPVDLPELTAGEWLHLLDSPVLSRLKELDITGGEPFLRKDLVQLFNGISALKRSSLPDLHSMAITTNGFLTDKVLGDVSAVVGPLEEAGVSLVFACGMDAIGETHNRIRNFKGGWDRLHETIKGLKELREKHPGLVIGIKTTITRFNIGELDKICGYADDHGLFMIISPYIVTANRYANLELDEELALSSKDLQVLKDFYKTSRFHWSYFRNELLCYLETGRMAKPCTAGFNYFFIRSTGEVFPCPIIYAPLGNVKEKPLADIIRSNEAARFRKGIGKFPECSGCTEPGLERYALPFEGFHYLREFFKTGRKGFLTLHRHLGLDKYFRNG